MNIYYILIVILSLAGFFLSCTINIKKRKPKPLVCPIGFDCDKVVRSEYSTFFGIKLENLGILYYGVSAILYTTLLILPSMEYTLILFLLTGIATGSFLFSIYLTFVQAFYIKQWCSWCLTSAGISTGIFGLVLASVITSGVSFIPLLVDYKKIVLILHLLGFALGVGGATFADIFFFKFLRDFKITKEEDNILRTMSQIIWVGLFIAIISGIGLYLPMQEVLNESSKFLTKVVVVTIITVNGAFLNLLISPRLVAMSFKKEMLNVARVHRMRKLSFALGAISFTSWYSAFILGTLKSLPFTFPQVLAMYIGLLVVAIIGSQIMERLFVHKYSKYTTDKISKE